MVWSTAVLDAAVFFVWLGKSSLVGVWWLWSVGDGRKVSAYPFRKKDSPSGDTGERAIHSHRPKTPFCVEVLFPK
jgi:hypothetical protein